MNGPNFRPGTETPADKLALVPFLRFCLFLGAGIAAAEGWKWGYGAGAVLLGMSLVLLCVRKTAGWGTALLLVALGAGLGRAAAPRRKIPRNVPVDLEMVLSGYPVRGEKWDRTESRVLFYRENRDGAAWHPVSEKVFLYSQGGRDGEEGPGDTLLLRRVYVNDFVNGSLPFDYASVMERKGFTGRVYVRQRQVAGRARSDGRSWNVRALRAQRFCRERLVSLGLDARNEGVLAALLVGDKGNLDREARQDYARVGVAHLLAVSGLHVMVLFWMLHVLLGVCDRVFVLRAAKVPLVVAVLWAYAWMTGLSPSVCRAALMATLFQCLQFTLRSSVNRYNVVFASAFLLLLVRPYALFDAGFRLSYAAVLAILFFGPRLDRFLPRTRFRMVRFFRSTFIVTFAAQLGTVPLVLYYFGQVPLLSLFTNLVLALFVTPVMLCGGVYLLWPTPFAGGSLKVLVQCQDAFVRTVSGWRFASVENIPFDALDCLLCYMGLGMIVLGMELHPLSRRGKVRFSRRKGRFGEKLKNLYLFCRTQRKNKFSP